MLNAELKEYFCDIAGIDTNRHFNDGIRAGLEHLGYTGFLNDMLRTWAVDQAGVSASITDALRLAMADMVGETSTFIGDLVGEYTAGTWDTILTKFEDEDRQWSYIN